MRDNDQPATGSLGDRVRSLRLGNRTEAGAAPRSRWIPWIFCAVCLLLTAAFGYRAYRLGPMGDLDSGDQGTKKTISDTQASALGSSSTASVGEVVLQAKGYVVPISLIQVSPKVGGQLFKIAEGFEEGAIFQKGQILAEIEDVDYRAERDQARASYEAAKMRLEETQKAWPDEIKQAKAELKQAETNFEQLEADLARNKTLARTRSVTIKDLEQIQTNAIGAKTQVARFKAALRLLEGPRKARIKATEADMLGARAMLEKAEWRLKNTKIPAPVTGTILTKKAEVGNIVNPAAFSSGISASLCEMADLSQLEIDLSIQERDIAQVKKGQPCLVMPEAYAQDKEFLKKHPQGYEGYVSRLMPTADRAKGAIPVRVRIKNIPSDEAGEYLRPDMGALVSFKKMPEKTKSNEKTFEAKK